MYHAWIKGDDAKRAFYLEVCANLSGINLTVAPSAEFYCVGPILLMAKLP